MDFNVSAHARRWGTVGASPVPEISNQAARYRKLFGVTTPENDLSRAAINPARSQEIGDAYDAMPAYSKEAEPAYRKFREETNQQFDFATKPRSKGGMGLDFEVTKQDPYGWGGQQPKDDYSNWDYKRVIPEARHDILEHGKMKVYSTNTTGGHPFMSDEENDRFRAVHDLFGHLGSGRGIDFNGEEGAYQAHAAMYSPEARGALATETRGQNSYLRTRGNFPEQKVGILPSRFQVARNLPGVRESDIRLARQKNREQGL